MARNLRRRLALLRRHIPELFEQSGKLLYVGATPERFQCGPELAEMWHEITLLEIWPPYAEFYEGHVDVEHVVCGDVRQVDEIELPESHYDVAFWWHGPEHVEWHEIGSTLAKLEKEADLVVIGCPQGEYPQEASDGNPHQVHRATLYAEDFRRWGYRVARLGWQGKRDRAMILAWKESGRTLPTVIAAVNAYQEERMLPGCLESIMGQVDRIVVVDGAYAHFPHEVASSTDATQAIAECYGAEWIAVPDGRAWATQVEKRSAYLVGGEGEWYLGIDADERLMGTLPVPEEGRHYAFRIGTRDGRQTWVPRLFQHRGWMRYEGSHNALWSDERLINLPGAERVEGQQCRFVHLAHLREEDRQLQKRRYYAWQKPAERGYRRAHGI